MQFLTVLFGFLNQLARLWQQERDKQAGRNEEKLENINEIEKRVKDADKIYNDPVLDDIDLFLQRRQPKKFE